MDSNELFTDAELDELQAREAQARQDLQDAHAHQINALNQRIVQLQCALRKLLNRWAEFTEDGWGNMSDAYYYLAKYAADDWKDAADLINPEREG